MLNSILVVLDGSAGDKVIHDTLANIPGHESASVRALALIDPAIASPPRAVPAGAIAMAKASHERAMAKSRHRLDASIQSFRAFCRERGIQLTVEMTEDKARPAIERRARAHDLVLMGRAEPGGGTGIMGPRQLMRLLQDCARPVVVATDDRQRFGEAVAIAYDGSAESERALELFLMLGLARDRRLEVVTIHEDQEEASTIAARGVAICARAGASAKPYAVRATAHRLPVLMNRLHVLRPGMLVVGSLGAGLLRKLFFGTGSETEAVLRTGATVFVHK